MPWRTPKLKRALGPSWDGRRIDIERVDAAIAVCTRDGQLVAASPPARELLKAARLPCAALPCPLPAALWQALGSRPYGDALDWRPPDAPEICLSWVLHRVGSSYLLAHIYDVSRRTDALAQRLYVQRQHMLGDLASTISHEIRTPLAAITFNIAVLRKRWRELDEAQVVSLLDEIHSACERQNSCIAALTDTTSLHQRRPLQLAAAFKRIVEIVYPIYRDRSHTLTVNVDEAHWVSGTSFALEHIFINLLVNAAQASQAPIAATVASEPTTRGDQRFIRVVVADSGPGIPPEIRPHIFDPFFTTKVSGNGIGLTNALQSIRDLGGDLQLVDAGSGARFEALLVACEPDGEGAP